MNSCGLGVAVKPFYNGLPIKIFIGLPHKNNGQPNEIFGAALLIV